LSDKDCVKPITEGKSLRLFLNNKKDFELFDKAATSELTSVTWNSYVEDDGLADEGE